MQVLQLKKHYVINIMSFKVKTNTWRIDFPVYSLRHKDDLASILVTEDRTQFTDERLLPWLKSMGCRNSFTPVRHLYSNGQTGIFVEAILHGFQHPMNLKNMLTIVLLHNRNCCQYIAHESIQTF